MESTAQFKLKGVVTPYTGNGRRLGFPTANIAIDSGVEEGLFVGYTLLNKRRLPSIIFIGAPVTLNDSQKRAESYILDFEDRDLYGEIIELEILYKLRDNHNYESETALVKQMQKDEIAAQQYFKEHK